MLPSARARARVGVEAVGVAAPVLAIAVSIALEGYQPGWETVLGVALAVLGNVWMLRPGGRSKR